MAKSAEVIWEMQPHTQAKHEILRRYLSAWLPIITRYNGRALYIDGFAGPGEYKNGEDGSPIIAIKAMSNHKLPITSEVVMRFIEKNKERCDFLETKISGMVLPKNLKYTCIHSSFEAEVSKTLDYLNEQKKRLAPSFVFIDPFGFTGIPMSLIKRIMEYDKCEVLITFMYEEINRFIQDEKLWDSLEKTFGTDRWKVVLGEANPMERQNQLHNVYKEQLEKEAGISYVRSFKMKNKKNKTDYFLFFGTNHILGIKKMKEAMWKVDEYGSFEFSDATYNPAQSVLLELEPNYAILKRMILDEFNGKSVSVDNLETFVLVKTPFRETHFRTHILKPMETATPPEIVVTSLSGQRRKGTFRSGSIIEFL